VARKIWRSHLLCGLRAQLDARRCQCNSRHNFKAI